MDSCSGPARAFFSASSPFLPLHLDRLVEQLAALEVVQHEVEQVDVLDPQPVLLLRDVVEQRAQVIPDPQFVFGRVIEDVEGDLVADTRCRSGTHRR